MASDRCFHNLAQAWIVSDPYKHRAMRILGVPELLITGPSPDREKFEAWAAIFPRLIGSPLYDWSVLELERYFGIREPLDPASAGSIWDRAGAYLQSANGSYQKLLERYPVTLVCTSDRLLDDCKSHAVIAANPKVSSHWLPSLRADDIVAVEGPDFVQWVRELGKATGREISDLDAFYAAISERLDDMDTLGCRLSDHGLDVVDYRPTSSERAAELFRRCLGGSISAAEATELRSALLLWLGGAYARRGWIMQLHLGARRRTSPRLRELAGPAGGYAAMGNPVNIDALCDWLAELEATGAMPRVNLYSLNPVHFPAFAVLTGSYAEDGVVGKIQFGPAWWWNDHRLGMREHLQRLAAHGVLSTFIGMTTDSRSVLSFVRHEYFRRVLCEWIGEEATAGRMPQDIDLLSTLVRRLCHGNADEIFQHPKTT